MFCLSPFTLLPYIMGKSATKRGREYYALIKKNEKVPSAAIGMLEMLTLSSLEKDKDYMVSLMWNLKNNTSDFTYKTET